MFVRFLNNADSSSIFLLFTPLKYFIRLFSDVWIVLGFRVLFWFHFERKLCLGTKKIWRWK